MKQPLISIVMATYNREEFIKEAISSVLNQDYENYELIIVDDGSTDQTKSLIEREFLSDRKVQYYFQENAGQMAAINYGLTFAKGDFIALIDSDNAWVETKLSQQMLEFERNPNVDIVYGDIITINEFSEEVHRNNMKRFSGKIAPKLLRDNCVSVNTALVKRKCYDELGGMSTEVEVAGDYELWLRFSSKYEFLYVPAFYARYRVMKDQISSDKGRRFRNTEVIVRRFIQNYPEATTTLEKKQGMAHFFIRKGRYFLEVENYREAYAAFLQALGFHPLYWPTYRALLRGIAQRFRLIN